MGKLMAKNFVLNEGYNKKIIFTGANGSKIYRNKTEIIDFSFSSGALLLGHRSNIFLKCLKDLLKKKISPLASPNTNAVFFSKILKKIFPHFSKFIFCSTGSESVVKALRISNSISNNNLVISVSGSWHGSTDKTLFAANKKMQTLPLSDGLSKFDLKNIKFIPYNNIKKSKEILDKYKHKISAIIIEPIQGGLPMYNIKKYLKFLKKYSSTNKKILIFDEMITGLRTDGKSVQSIYGIKPDISLFGKTFGGGMPIGIIGLAKKIESSMKKNNIFLGGTFSGNSISTYFGALTTEYIFGKRKLIFKDLEKKSRYLQEKITENIIKNNLKVKVYRFKSMLRIIFSDEVINDRTQRDFFEKKNKKKIDQFRKFLLTKKIYYPTNGIIFISSQTSYQDLRTAVKYFTLALKKFN